MMNQEEINDMREIRKLLNIFETLGNVLANGVPTADRLRQLITKYKNLGYAENDIRTRIEELEHIGYPAK